MNDALQQLLDRLTALLAEKPLIGAWYTTVVRFVFPLLALMILVGAIRSLWKVKHPDEVWGYLVLRNGVRLPITHWENIIGRAPSCDVQLEYPSVSRQHAALIREDDGSWTIYDLGSKGGIKVNDLPVDEYALVEDGDTVTFAGIPAIMEPITAEEKRAQMVERRIEGQACRHVGFARTADAVPDPHRSAAHYRAGRQGDHHHSAHLFCLYGNLLGVFHHHAPVSPHRL